MLRPEGLRCLVSAYASVAHAMLATKTTNRNPGFVSLPCRTGCVSCSGPVLGQNARQTGL